jgi:hypothetical protein
MSDKERPVFVDIQRGKRTGTLSRALFLNYWSGDGVD